MFIGEPLRIFETVDSTNEQAKRALAKNKPTEGTAIFAWHQSQGKGQIGNSWFGEPKKNIAVSLILYPGFLAVADQFLLNISISLAVEKFVSNCLEIKTNIKWPNDIYFQNKKLGGILIENILSGKKIQSSIVGIGLNVNQIDFPKEIPNPTSFARIGKKEFSPLEILKELFYSIESEYLKLKAGKQELSKKEYLENLYNVNEPAIFIFENNKIQGVIKEIDRFGKLGIEIEGQLQFFDFKEIELVL